MKKTKALLSGLVLGLIITVNIEAKTSKEVYISTKNIQKSSDNKISTKAKPEINYSIENFSENKFSSLQKIDGIFYLYDQEIYTQDIKETISNDSIILEYKDDKNTILKSVYNKIDDTKGYAHVQNIVTDEAEDYAATRIYNFSYHVNNYATTTDLKSGNATNDYHLASYSKRYTSPNSPEEVKYYNSTSKSVYNYSSRNNYEYIGNTKFLSNRLVLSVSNKTVIATLYEYSSSNILKSKYITYFIDALKSLDYASSVLEGELINWDYSKIYTYNLKKQVTGYFIEDKNGKLTHKEYMTYHTNGKVKQRNIYKRNSKNALILSQKIAYLSNGKKYSYKVRNYKAGKVVKQRYYRYDKSGLLKKGAYRKTVVYYKAKAYKAYSNTYNSKGKLSKSKAIKLTKTLSKW